jgi:hypothetical protein
MAVTLSERLSRKEFKAAHAAARAGDYQLFLGAGASVGAVNANGALPLAKTLVRMLQVRYPKAPIGESDALARAYQRAILVSSRDDVYRTLREIFIDARHEGWFRELAGLPWRRVWTLNVDDAFENEYAKTARSRHQQYRTISWDDPYSETGALEVVHLHGHVHSREPRSLVFSFSEYQSAARERPVWDQMLAGLLATKPVVALGARLLDDVDVESLFVNSRPTAAAPSIVVDPYITDGNEFELTALGYRVLRCSAAEFVAAWAAEFGLDSKGLDSLRTSTAIEIPQISILKSNHVPPPPPAHDYFGGDEPMWADICSNRAALFGWMREAIGEVERWLDAGPGAPSIHLLYGHRLTGTSSGMLMVAREARRLHVETVWFDKSSRLDVEQFLDFCRNRGPVMLMADGAADFADDIDRIAKRAAEDSSIHIFVLMSERPYNDLRVEGRLVGTYSKRAQRIPRLLDRGDSRSLVSKLEEFGRLGALELRPTQQRIAHFKGRDVFSALVDVEYALGFRKRLEGELRSIEEVWKKDLLFLLSFGALAGAQVGVVEAALAVGVNVSRVVKAVEGDEHLSALVQIVDDRVVARQRDRATDFMIRDRGESEALKALVHMIEGLAPLATRQGLRERNRAAVLVGRLMNAKQLARLFPKQDLDAFFFEALRGIFGSWHGRYWEQRAIYAKSVRKWSRAESFAARAVQLYDDAFTRTTYGTILVNRAEELAGSDDPAYFSFYERGKVEFDAALAHEPGNRVTAFAFLEASLGLLREIARQIENSQMVRGDVGSILSDWRGAYSSLRLSLSSDEGFESVSRAESLGERFESLPSLLSG